VQTLMGTGADEGIRTPDLLITNPFFSIDRIDPKCTEMDDTNHPLCLTDTCSTVH